MKYNVIGHNKTTNREKIVLVLDNHCNMSPKQCMELINPKQCMELINSNQQFKVELKESVC